MLCPKHCAVSRAVQHFHFNFYSLSLIVQRYCHEYRVDNCIHFYLPQQDHCARLQAGSISILGGGQLLDRLVLVTSDQFVYDIPIDEKQSDNNNNNGTSQHHQFSLAGIKPRHIPWPSTICNGSLRSAFTFADSNGKHWLISTFDGNKQQPNDCILAFDLDNNQTMTIIHQDQAVMPSKLVSSNQTNTVYCLQIFESTIAIAQYKLSPIVVRQPFGVVNSKQLANQTLNLDQHPLKMLMVTGGFVYHGNMYLFGSSNQIYSLPQAVLWSSSKISNKSVKIEMLTNAQLITCHHHDAPNLTRQFKLGEPQFKTNPTYDQFSSMVTQSETINNVLIIMGVVGIVLIVLILSGLYCFFCLLRPKITQQGSSSSSSLKKSSLRKASSKKSSHRTLAVHSGSGVKPTQSRHSQVKNVSSRASMLMFNPKRTRTSPTFQKIRQDREMRASAEAPTIRSNVRQ